jgi:hypothetical protein
VIFTDKITSLPVTGFTVIFTNKITSLPVTGITVIFTDTRGSQEPVITKCEVGKAKF